MTDSLTPPSVADLVERLEDAADRVAKRAMGHDAPALISIPRVETDVDAIIIAAATALRSLAAERDELLEALKISHEAILAIQQATLEGRVCDDVAWFSTIETLHDFCAASIDRIDDAAARSRLSKGGDNV